MRHDRAAARRPSPFDVVIVHSFSRFFRDAFDMEFYVRKLAKNGIKLLSITQEIVVVPVPPIIERETFDAVQALLKARHPTVTPSAVISGPTMLTGLIHCAKP